MAEVNTVIEELRLQNQSLQEQVTTIQNERDPNHLDNVKIENPQPLTDSIMNNDVPPNFKLPPLEAYNGKWGPRRM